MLPLYLSLIGIILAALAEAKWPRRDRDLTRLERWGSALSLLTIGSIVSRVILPVGLIGLALWLETYGIGLFNMVDSPLWLEVIIALLLLDLAIWAQHLAMHRVECLWRFHRVHHTDPDFDVMTALRFHPGELVISLLWKGLVIALLGASPWAVLIFVTALSLAAVFNHANLGVPIHIDRWLRLFIVTPDMHRVHHSVYPVEGHCNFGFFIPWWDRVFGLYQAEPRDGHTGMRLGHEHWRGADDQALGALLAQPFQSEPPRQN
ncbi:MAG: sterol desaturase family protein [Pseudomonadota bacterium]